MDRLIDSHAHLDFPQFGEEIEAILTRASTAGVEHVVTIGTTVESSRASLALAIRYAQLSPTAGVHPHEAGAFDEADWPDLVELWRRPEVCGVGETGLDYHYNFSPASRQRALFERHLEAAAEHQKPVVVHLREAFDDGFSAMESVGLPAGGVLHCFTGGPSECERALSLGLHISLSGIVTFRSARALRAAALLVPDERLLIETDAPYLAPVPERGKRNEPAFVAHTARHVAGLRGQPYGELCAVTRANAIRLFGLHL